MPGSLEHGRSLDIGTEQVLRAGGAGFTHNEISLDARENQMIRLRFLSDEAREPAGYMVYPPTDTDIREFALRSAVKSTGDLKLQSLRIPEK